MMRWEQTTRADAEVARLADRHYSRQKPGTAQFVPPGRCLVLRTPDASAGWVTSWQRAEFQKHSHGDAWVCTFFRNEGPHLSSELIREALAASLWYWSAPSPGGVLTFINDRKVRRKRDPGRCFLRAGFRRRAERTSERGLIVLHLPASDLPAAVAPRNALSLGAG